MDAAGQIKNVWKDGEIGWTPTAVSTTLWHQQKCVKYGYPFDPFVNFFWTKFCHATTAFWQFDGFHFVVSFETSPFAWEEVTIDEKYER